MSLVTPIWRPEGANAANDALARALALQPLLAEAAPQHDRTRELSPAVIEALHAADFYRLLLPRSIGGQETPLPLYAQAIEALAYADASTAWCLNQSNVSTCAAAYMDREAAREMFGQPATGLAWGSRHDRSVVVAVDGGYLVTGRWSFASGNRHVPWMGAHSLVRQPDGSPVLRPDGTPEERSFLFPRGQAAVTDDWQVLGLRGTGSDTYEVRELFVPAARCPARDRPEERRENGPLYKFVSHIAYASGFSGIALGVARSLLDAATALCRGKNSRAAINPLAQNQAVQQNIAGLEARWHAARAYWLQTMVECWKAAQQDELPLSHRLSLRLATTHAMNEATEVSVGAYRATGAHGPLDSQPFERRFRDAMTVSQHLQASAAHVEAVGRHLLGAEAVGQFYA